MHSICLSFSYCMNHVLTSDYIYLGDYVVLLCIYTNNDVRYNCELDTSGAVGRRYRRADEIGVPFCITVDFESLEDKCVTLRDRDSMAQRRVPIASLAEELHQELELSDDK